MELVLDSSALLCYFKNERGADKVEAILKDAESDRREAHISAVTLAETKAVLARFFDLERATSITAGIKSSLSIIPVTAEIAELAGELKFKHSKQELSMADAIIAATALIIGSTLLTTDSDFKNIEGLGAVFI